ncbi:epoxide hydrolase family protein [Polaribacter cellanae]|uniref:Epoxide hydrolase n=1 Tax=Polaribacter cellanae TaxID=2818493 RepID=A0A975H8N9_9FLAO|nr:epoxide hydrolase family protein [Polaribacter cellanae]QTE24269.1 epoxide hydrolase [Polaribacter cellanae]
MKSNLTPFKIQISDKVLNDLQTRLSLTRWPDEPENANWSYGTNLEYLKELVHFWQNQYDWRANEKHLNQYPQFKETVDGVGIHFVYIKGKGKNSKPLILTHGWPDSFYRFYKAIPMLTESKESNNPSDFSFDVIIPSIPGFGFSDKTALDDDRTAKIWNSLMTDILGYKEYFAAGGDMGANITKSLANQFPDAVKAIHLTDVGYPNGSEDWSQMSEAEQKFGQHIQQWFYTEGAFNMVQSTKPQTLAYGLNDSPVGLAAWIIEKFNSWSDNNGNIENCFTKNELLTNIMIYWVTETINSSIRTYKNVAMASYSGGLKSSEYVEVPTGVSGFPGEAPVPKEWMERKVNLKKLSYPSKGGHFAAMEVPEFWTKEITSFFSDSK